MCYILYNTISIYTKQLLHFNLLNLIYINKFNNMSSENNSDILKDKNNESKIDNNLIKNSNYIIEKEYNSNNDNENNNNNKNEQFNNINNHSASYNVSEKLNNENGMINCNNDNKQNTFINKDYYNEGNIPKYNEIIDYENKLRQEIEEKSPLISNVFPVEELIKEYQNSINFSKSILEIQSKYKYLRYARRDGNCFYRSFLYRLFEHIIIKNDINTYNMILKKLEKCKDLLEFNGFEWSVCEEFYNSFINEFKFFPQLEKNEKLPYLNLLFSDKVKCNYLISFVRMYISAYIKENRILYENFLFDEDLDSWCRREVEPIDVECDHLQIIAVTNCFGVGVVIQNLNEKKIDTMKFPEEGIDNYFIHMFFRPGHYDILYNDEHFDESLN